MRKRQPTKAPDLPSPTPKSTKSARGKKKQKQTKESGSKSIADDDDEEEYSVDFIVKHREVEKSKEKIKATPGYNLEFKVRWEGYGRLI